MENLRISQHISYAEATKSQQAVRFNIINKPNEEQLESMRNLANKVFEPIRRNFKKPIAITSFFRSPALNKVIGGSLTSQHCKGEAMDIDADVFGGVTNSEIFHFIKNNLDFDQLIWEFGNHKEPDWVHVSLRINTNRRQILRAEKRNGSTVYIKIQ